MAEIDKFQLMEVHTKAQAEALALAKKRKKRNYIVGFSILGAVVVILAIIYALAANIWLANLANLPYLQYTYQANVDNPKATITRLVNTSDYPSNFKIPDEVNGIPVVAIADGAFDSCTRLTSVTIPDSVTSIGQYAFANCENLATINFSNNITSLGTGAFQNTAFLNNLPEDDITIISSILFKIGEDIVEENTILLNDTNSVIPSKYQGEEYHKIYLSDYLTQGQTVSVWSDGLFADMSNLVYVELPDYLTLIPINSFDNCINLEGVSIPESVTTISDNAFRGCVKLNDIVIGDTVTSVGASAFAYTGISEIDLPTSMISIGQRAFEGCENITSFTWPSNLTSIPNYAFSGCINLSEFILGEGAFDNIVSIGEYAFNNTAISEFDIPYNVSVVSSHIFSNCEQLETIRLYQGKTTYDKHGTPYVTGVIRIDQSAFENSSLSSIVLYDDNQNSLTPLNEINLPTTLSSVAISSSQGSTFANNDSITKVNIPYSLVSTSYQMFLNATNLQEVNFQTRRNGTRYQGVTTIGYQTFAGCTSITTLSIPDTVTVIEDGAFANMTGLENIKLSNNTTFTSFAAYLFDGCSSLTHIDIPENVYTFNNYAFRGNHSLDYIYIPYSQSGNITLYSNTFTNMRPANEDGTYSERLAIFINCNEDELNQYRVSKDFYDDSCVVYWAGEFEVDPITNIPTPIVSK